MTRSEPLLVVIRGNSASGKSTVATGLQRRFERGECAVVAQDTVRRQILREFDEPGAFNIRLIEQIATACLQEGMVVIVEGILDARKYGPMLKRLTDSTPQSLFYAFDLTFEETLLRHATRPQAASIPEALLADWYRGWQPLTFVAETRIDATWSIDATIDRIHRDIARHG
ncbi:AAA family ATPase [Nocardia colli]|uniref:AAA family ATPase n=1 Tax=Nocardia colli TaxID=2545717 RepID=UPI0035DCA1F6